MSERDLLECVGMDGAMYLRFFQMGLKYFGSVLILGIILIIVDYKTYRPKEVVDTFQEMTISNLADGSVYLYIHLIMLYGSTLYLFYLLYHEYGRYISLRHIFYLTDIHTRHIRLSVFVRNIPPQMRDTQKLQEFFRQLYPNCTPEIMLAYDVRQLATKVQACEGASRSLERAQYDWNNGSGNERPLKFTQCFTEKVDAIEYWQQQIEKLNDEIITEQQNAKPTSCAFLTFPTFEGSTIATQMMQTLHPFQYRARLAPEPRDVIWAHLGYSPLNLAIRRVLSRFIIFLLVAFWFVPVAFISALTSLENLTKLVPFLEPIINAHPVLKGTIQGYLPGLALIVFMAIIPYVCRFVGMFRKIEANSWLEMYVFRTFFYFQMCNFFLGVTIGGAFISILEEISLHPGSIPTLLSSSLPAQASTFIVYIMLRTLVGFPSELLRLYDLIVGKLMLRFWAKTEKDRKQSTTITPIRYAEEYPKHLLVFIIGIAYLPIAPLVIPFVALFFLMGTVVNRYVLLYIHEPQFESGGTLFPVVFNHIIVGCLIGQFTLIGVFALKESPGCSSATLLLVGITVFYWKYTTDRFKSSSHRLSRYESVLLDSSTPISEDSTATPSMTSPYQAPSLTASPIHLDSNSLKSHGSKTEIEPIHIPITESFL
jgi:lysine-specific demethylase 3